ncbi:MAG: T9SS type A sorting domain-containing protein [bacterium]|nr:T9SS type A sorting domain-containing protein [bacterium]
MQVLRREEKLLNSSMGVLLGMTITCYLIFSGIMAGPAYAGPNANASVVVDLDPSTPGYQSSRTVAPNTTFQVDIVATGTVTLDTYDLKFQVSDSSKLQIVGTPTEGPFLRSLGGTTLFMPATIGSDTVQITNSITGNDTSLCPSGEGVLAHVTLEMLSATDNATVSFSEVKYFATYSVLDIITNIVGGTVEPAVVFPFDSNFDCYIDYHDLFDFSRVWHRHEEDTGFNPIMDCPADGYIDYHDLFNFARIWHKHCSDTIPITSCSPSVLMANSEKKLAEVKTSGMDMLFSVRLDLDPKTSEIESARLLTSKESVKIDIVVEQVKDIHGLNIDFLFNEEKTKVLQVVKGNLIKDMSFFQVDMDKPGLVNISGSFLGMNPGVDGPGILASVILEVKDLNELVELGFEEVIFADHNGLEQNVTMTAVGGMLRLAVPELAKDSLFQNYPNPLNPETWLPFSLATKADVGINIYSLSGQLIRSLNLGEKEAGFYTAKGKGESNSAVYWDGKDESGKEVASGVYFYQLRAGSFVSTRKMIVLK